MYVKYITPPTIKIALQAQREAVIEMTVGDVFAQISIAQD